MTRKHTAKRHLRIDDIRKQPPRYLNVQGVVHHSGIGEHKVRLLLELGIMKSARLSPKNVMIPITELDRLFELLTETGSTLDAIIEKTKQEMADNILRLEKVQPKHS